MEGDRTARPDPRDESTGELLRDLARGTAEIARKQVRLAQAELEQVVKQSQRATIWLVLALAPVLMALVLMPLAIVWGFDAWLPRWAAALVAAGVMMLVAAVLALVGRAKLREVEPKPERTIDELEENKEWLKTRVSSSVRSTRSAAT